MVMLGSQEHVGGAGPGRGCVTAPHSGAGSGHPPLGLLAAVPAAGGSTAIQRDHPPARCWRCSH